jgi:O-antigen ligase
MKDVLGYIREHLFTFALMVIFVYLCCNVAISGKVPIAMGLGMLPCAGILFLACIRWPNILLVTFFIFNYIIMGLGRYVSIPVPTTILFEMFFVLMLICYTMGAFTQPADLAKAANLYWLFAFLWMIYSIINVANGITGSMRTLEWYKMVRPMACYPLIVSVIVSLYARKYTFIRNFMVLWGIMILLAFAKGYWQRRMGFDNAEWVWLMTVGHSTHLISSGVRYFSFFTDAANYGCGLGMSFVTYAIAALYTKNRKLQIFYVLVALGSAYSMLISGTRAALAAPIVGVAMYIVLCKNWKISVSATIMLAAMLFILIFTHIGEGNPLIRRMRTAFDKEDASMNTRYENQKALKAYMSEAPFGIGMGLDGTTVSQKNKFYLAAHTPPDSDWVNIWIHMGKIGLIVYLGIQGLVLVVGGIYILFRIKHDEIRGPLMGMLCGCGGLLIASYANMVYFQFPNGPIAYACLTLVFMGPYFDKQYDEEHGIAKA